MNRIIVTLVVFFACLQASSQPQIESIDLTRRLLNINSTLQDKARGLALARRHDDPSVNEALVAMLSDQSPGGRVSYDEAVEMPWIESMHILAGRFPEAKVRMNIDYRYVQQDRVVFLGWWSANRERIKYRGNNHTLEAIKDAGTNVTEISGLPAPPDPIKNNGSLGSTREPPRTVQPSKTNEPETKPIPTLGEVLSSLTPYGIIIGLVVSAGGLLWLLLKRRS
jgi:hypothetical protein